MYTVPSQMYTITYSVDAVDTATPLTIMYYRFNVVYAVRGFNFLKKDTLKINKVKCSG